MELTTEIYAITRRFLKEELYGLTLQARRSAVSIPSNIAEGAARNSRNEFIQFLYVALGSAASQKHGSFSRNEWDSFPKTNPLVSWTRYEKC